MKIFRTFLIALSILGFTLGANIQVAVTENSKIVGGIDAQPGAWPFMVGLLNAGTGNRFNRQFCGGSLIASRWVLTAAHCIHTTTAGNVEVLVGGHDLNNSSEGEEIAVAQIVEHPDYNPTTSDYDKALLELAADQTMGATITRATGSETFSGFTATAIGWGALASGGAFPNILQQVDVPVITNASCSNAYGNITDRMVCAGFDAGGKDTCQGDSGGPLVVTDNNVLTLIGATSFGNGCAQPNFPGVYARVSEVDSWIDLYAPDTIEEPTVTGPYGLWNGFLGMVNIVELVNEGSSDVSATVNLYNSSGAFASTTTVTVEAGKQVDVILNDMSGFQADAYGLIRTSNNVSGRVFYYKTLATGFSDFDFAFGVPLSQPLTGETFVAFNTFDPDNAGNLVANWHSIVNLADTAKSFRVIKYNILGEELSNQVVQVESKQRVDRDGGHVNPGASQVGMINVQPLDNSAPYLSQLMRYGYEGDGNTFKFAFPLISQAELTNAVSVPLGDPAATYNWLEVVNTSGSSRSVQVDFYGESGNAVDTRSITLLAHSQQHIDAAAILGAGAIGQAVITPEAGGAVISESMFYFRNSLTGTTSSMFGSQARAANDSAVRGSYNMFLGMTDSLRISNASSSSINVGIAIESLFSSGSSSNATIPAFGSAMFTLNDSQYGTVADSYGTVTLTPPSGGDIIAEVIRRRFDANSQPQFIAPTSLSPTL